MLRGISFDLHAGELLQVVGPNGVGKSSLLRCACGLLPVESGEVAWNGRPIERSRGEFHCALAYLAHANALKADLTALENLMFEVALRRDDVTREMCLDMLERLEIPACADLHVRLLSAGQRRRVALARVLLSGARLWILDEPTTNLDAAGIARVEQCMAEHLQGGGMILTAAHQLLLEGYAGARTLELQR